MSSVNGFVIPEFYPVREAFEQLLMSDQEKGASLAIVHRGELVVDIWGGTADEDEQQGWQQDTIANAFSCTKGIATVCVLKAVEQGLFSLNDLITDHWPEFRQEGKAHLRISDILSHKTGVSAIDHMVQPEHLYDWNVMCAAVAEQAPWWAYGTHGYAPLTFGWMIGEVFQRATGRSIGQFLQQEIAGPLNLDCFIGTPESEFHRCAKIGRGRPVKGDPMVDNLFKEIMTNPTGVCSKAFANPTSAQRGTNSKAWREMELPSANGHTNGRALATLYGALANGGAHQGVQILKPETLNLCWSETVRGYDPVLRTDTRFSTGFMMSQESRLAKFGGTRSFGHPGAGGSIGFADPDKALGFGFIHNLMGPYILVDPRAEALIEAAYDCLS
ncbi:serine hydrolase domain-containing protein [Litoribacillus peritrichatus]